jgi:hypothetical protein
VSIDGLSPRGRQLAGAMARNFELLAEYAKQHPTEVLLIVEMARKHLDNAWPQAALEEKT